MIEASEGDRRAHVRPRILMVGKGPPDRGGIPSTIASFLGGPLARRFDLEFVNLAREGPQRGGRWSLANVRRTLEDAGALRRAIGRLDIVHLHTALVPSSTAIRAWLLALVARSRGAKVVIHVHGGRLLLWLREGWRSRLLRLALAPAHRVVSVSSSTATLLEEALGEGRVLHIPNTVDLLSFRPGRLQEGWATARILYVGLLTPRKGLLDLFAATRILQERRVPHELWLAGGTPDEGPAAEAEVRLAAPAAVRFLGRQSPADMPEVYRRADLFCLPSWWEAMPLSLLEAMASGLPCVATSVGDIPEMMEDEVTGLLVPPRDPSALADALAELIGDPDLREAMGGAARRRVEAHFSSDRSLELLEALYRELSPS